MKSTTNRIFAAVAAAVIAPAITTMANSGLLKVTVANDTPYRQRAELPVASSSGTKFQIAPVKMQTTSPATNAAASVSRPVPRPHWR
jgi:hypothetical protein